MIVGKRRVLAVVAPLFAVTTLACSLQNDKSEYFGTTTRSGKDIHTFYVNNGSEPEYLDPGMAHDTASSTLIENLFEGLLTYGPDAEPRPAVAKSFDQTKDNRFFRFHLRDDARWSDGKPVTAHDFEFAWKRVLVPATGSQSASIAYVLKNGEALNTARILTTKVETTLLSEANANVSAENTISKLAPGTPLFVIARSPQKVATSFAPFTEAPAAKEMLFDKADPKAKTPERIVVDGKSLGAASGDWKGDDVRIVKRLGPVTCNGAADFFFEVVSNKGKGRGVLPGCLLEDTKAEKKFALVGNFVDIPTFKANEAPPPDAPPKAPPEPIGFVDLSFLASDPSVVGVRAVDDHTLEAELEIPAPFFIDLLCHATMFPVRKDVVERFVAMGTPDMWTRPENIVSNGPYVLDTHKFRYEITMNRNPFYYDRDKLKIHRIVFFEVEESIATMNLYQAGDIDYLGDNSTPHGDYIKFLSTKKDFEKTSYLGTYWYEFNTKTPPTDNVLVRRALNLSVDKAQLVDKVVLGGQPPASHYVPDTAGLGYSDYVTELKAAGQDVFDGPDYRFNPERARQLMAEAGYPVVKEGDGYRAQGFPSLELLYNTSEGHRKIAVAIQDMWKRHLGVSVALRNEEWRVMLKNVRDRNFQVARFGWIADYNHPHTWLDTLLSYSPNNRTGWVDPTFDTLLKKAAATADTRESMKLYRDAEKIAVDAMAKMPIYFYTKNTLVKPWVKGFHFNARNNQLVKYVWIDEAWRTNADDSPAYPLTDVPPPGAY